MSIDLKEEELQMKCCVNVTSKIRIRSIGEKLILLFQGLTTKE